MPHHFFSGQYSSEYSTFARTKHLHSLHCTVGRKRWPQVKQILRRLSATTCDTLSPFPITIPATFSTIFIIFLSPFAIFCIFFRIFVQMIMCYHNAPNGKWNLRSSISGILALALIIFFIFLP
jgi:ABC-type anion transport system duplicated permease subunit